MNFAICKKQSTRQACYVAVFFLAFASAWADGLVTNYVFGATAGTQPGQLMVVGRGDASNGVSILQLALEQGQVRVSSFRDALFGEEWLGVHDRVFSELTGEARRVPSVWWQGRLMFAAIGLDSNHDFNHPAGLIQVMNENATLVALEPGELATGNGRLLGLQVAPDQALWMPRGIKGLLRIPAQKQTSLIGPLRTARDTQWVFSSSDHQLTPVRLDSVPDSAACWEILALAVDSSTGRMWLGTEKGLWSGQVDQTTLTSVKLGGVDTLRITGIWQLQPGDGGAAGILVESSQRLNSRTQSSLFWVDSLGKATSVRLKDRDGKLHANGYDSLQVSISSMAVVGHYVWAAVQGIENNLTGLLRIQRDSMLAVSWSDSLSLENGPHSSPWLWWLEAGVVDREILVTSVASFPLKTDSSQIKGLAVTTYGAGVSISIDSGATWKVILNQAPIRGGLKEVRMVPSVMRGWEATSQVAYRLDKNAQITIEIFSYDMKPVRTLIRGAARNADPIRSSDPRTDVWDGRDDFGSPVALGLYYVKVKDDDDHESWGKVMWLGGGIR